MASATVVLCLSKAEAEALFCVVNRIAGHPQKSRRKHTESISDALEAAGVAYHKPDDLTGEIRFV